MQIMQNLKIIRQLLEALNKCWKSCEQIAISTYKTPEHQHVKGSYVMILFSF